LKIKTELRSGEIKGKADHCGMGHTMQGDCSKDRLFLKEDKWMENVAKDLVI
jgi:hypothetical protein